jgi:hypothetical protein
LPTQHWSLSISSSLQKALESALNDTLAERDLCIQIKASLEQRLARVQEKQELNESRLQVMLQESIGP